MNSLAGRLRMVMGLLACAWVVLGAANVLAEPVDQATAGDIASQHVALRFSQWQANAGRRVVAKRRMMMAAGGVTLPPETREITPLTDPKTGQTLGYVIALNPVGYMVTSADTDVAPVIAFSFRGNFSFEDRSENILLRMLQTDLRHRLKSRADLPAARLAANQAMWSPPADGGEAAADGEAATDGGADADGEVGGDAVQTVWGPLLDTTWSQGYYYNKYCPIDPLTEVRCATGCSATMMAQIINYWEYPSSIMFAPGESYPSVMSRQDGYGTRYIWIDATEASIPHIDYNGNPEDANQPTHDMIGHLMFACGVSIGMRYSSAGSAGSGSLSRWGYTSSDGTLADRMKAGHPAMVSIAMDPDVCPPDEDCDGHAIVCDGYWEVQNPGGDPPVLDAFHFNFGWGGGTDGWYMQGGFPGYWIWLGGGTSVIPPAPDILAMADANVVLGVRYTAPTPAIDPATKSRPMTWTLPDANNVEAGIDVDPATGVVTWYDPGELDDVQTVTLHGKNEAGEDEVTFQLTVTAPPSGPPIIEDIEDGQVGTGEGYVGPVPVLLQGTLPVTWSLADPNNVAAGMGINPATGKVTWPHAAPSNSVHTITIQATNQEGSGTASWNVEVIPPPGPPLIAELEDETIPAGPDSPYTGPKPRLERGTFPVTWSLADPNNTAAGMTIDWAGVVSWPNPGANNSTHMVRVRATNAEGNHTRPYTLKVTIPVGVPVIDGANFPNTAVPAESSYESPVPVLLAGTLPVTWSLPDANNTTAGMTIDPGTGVVTWPQPGPVGTVHSITIQAENSVGDGSLSWFVLVTLPAGPPVIEEIADDALSGPNYPPYVGPMPVLTRGSDPITWSFADADSIPAGMTIDPNNGRVEWPNPGPAGTEVTVEIKAGNSEGQDTESWLLTLNMPPTPPAISTVGTDAEIPGGANHPYQSIAPVATGTQPIAWSLPDANNVNVGMTINQQTGVVNWSVPGSVGSVHYVTIQATNVGGQDTAMWVLTVVPPPVAPVIDEIADHSTPGGSEYQGPLPGLPADTTTPVTWSLPDAGNTAAGMTIDPNTGVVFWPDPSPVGSVHTITVKALNSVGVDTESWQLTVTLPTGPPVIGDIADDTIPAGSDYPYQSAPMPLLEGTEPITWSLPDANNVSAGMSIDSQTGAVAWPEPGEIGSVHIVTVKAVNGEGEDTKAYKLTVTYPYGPPVLSPMDDETILAGPSHPYVSPEPTVEQGSLPITWSLSDPNNSISGMTVNASTGEVSWDEPGPAGSVHVVTVKAANGLGQASVSWTLTVILPPAPPTIGSVDDEMIPAGPDHPYQGPAPSVEGSVPIEWSLPDPNNSDAGMTIDQGTGVVRWLSPGPIGSVHIVTAKAENYLGEATVSWKLSITPPLGTPIIGEIDNATIPAGADHPYQSAEPNLDRGSLPVMWSLPDARNVSAGMMIDQATGAVGWLNPGPIGSVHAVTIKARNNDGQDTATYQLTVAPPLGSPVIDEIADATVAADAPYEGEAPTLSKGSLPVTWSLPDANNTDAGMLIDEGTGVVVWDNSSTAGSPHFVLVMAENNEGSATQTYKLAVTGVPVIAPIAGQTATEGQPFVSAAIPLASGEGVTWSFADPAAVPSNMSIEGLSTGVISWSSPTTVGSPFTIALKATNVAGSDEQDMTIVVVKPTVPPVIAPMENATVVKGHAYRSPMPLLLEAGPGTTWELPGASPGGMAINEATGVVSWSNPIDSGDEYVVTIRAKNAAGQADVSWKLTVKAPLVPVTIAVAPASAGMSVTVDDQAYVGSHTFNWEVGGSHQIAVDVTQTGGDGETYLFKSWSDGNGSESRTVTVSVASSLTATMRKVVASNVSLVGPDTVPENSSRHYTLNLTMSDGTVTEVTADATWRLSSVSCADVVGGKVTAREVDKDTYCEVYATYIKDSASLSARMPITIANQLKSYMLTVLSSPEGAAVPAPTTCTEGEIVSVPSPGPAKGMVFVEWRGDAGGTDDPLTITMDGDKTVIAYYESTETGSIIPVGLCGTGLVSSMLCAAVGMLLMRGLQLSGRRRRR